MSERAYIKESIAVYLDKLASGEPEPGGGSAAALAGALGAALVSMVTNLTLGKEKYAGVQDDIATIKQGSERLRHRLGELASLDADVYAAVAAAMKLPREDEQEKKVRRDVLQAALKRAAEVPTDVAEAAAEVARLALKAAEKGNTNAVSDAGVAVVFAEAAAQAAALNVKINLAWIEDEGFKHRVWSVIEGVLTETARLRDVVLGITYSKI
jgi:formiminotetrahydrofolate cyclodeaminase